MKLKFGQYFAADVLSNLGQDAEERFGQDFKFKFSWMLILVEISKF